MEALTGLSLVIIIVIILLPHLSIILCSRKIIYRSYIIWSKDQNLSRSDRNEIEKSSAKHNS